MTDPTDEEIMELMPQQMRDDLAAAARALAGFTGPKASTACRIILNCHAVSHVRAVLARWSCPTPQPVPVSERLPGPEDCDEQGRCWWFSQADPPGDWYLDLPVPAKAIPCYGITHWLPANALPIPSAQ